MNRRDFLKTSGAVSAALGLANSAAGAGTGMFIALNTSLVGGKVQWPEFARLAAKVGYGGTDLNLPAATEARAGCHQGLVGGVEAEGFLYRSAGEPHARG